MVSIDSSVIIQIVNFLFLIWALNIVLYKPIRNILIRRNDKFTDLKKRTENFANDAKEKDDAYSSGIREARAKGLKEKEVLLTAATDEEKKIIGDINKKAQADFAEIREKIAKDAEGVRIALQKETDAFANAIGQKILGRAV